MERRKMLAVVAGGITPALAGCSFLGGAGDPGDGPDDEPPNSVEVDENAPARVEMLDVRTDGEVQYGEQFELRVTVGNSGGQPVADDAAAARVSLTRLGPDADAGQVVELRRAGLAPGAVRTQAVGPFDATAAGDFRLEPTAGIDAVRDDVEQLVTVVPRQAAAGERIETPENLRLTVTDVTYEQSLLSPDGDGWAIRKTLDDRIIAVARLSVENAATGRLTVPRDTLVVDGGAPVTDLEAHFVDGPDLREYGVNPGETETGWMALAGDVDTFEQADLGLSVAGGEKPEVVVATDGVEFPEFELVDQDVFEQFQPGVQQMSFEVENVGDGIGVFRGFMQYQFTDNPGLFSSKEAGVWYSDFFDPVGAEIPPGGTRTVEFETDYDGDTDVRYGFQPFEYEWLAET